MVRMFLERLVAATAVLLACAGATSGDGAQHALTVACTNPSSGAHWEINIDYDHATVDTNPATVSAEEVTWRDAKDGWNYKLDRKSGELTVTVASSTGGYFLHDRCQLPP
jgi:hypothetical protein